MKWEKEDKLLATIFSILILIFTTYIVITQISLQAEHAGFTVRCMLFSIPFFFIVLTIFFWILWVKSNKEAEKDYEEAKKKDKPICPICGEYSDLEMQNCPSCGAKFD